MRWVIRLVALVVVLAVVAIGSLFLLPGDRIARIAADQITSATGRQVTMTGDTKISFYPVLGVSTGAVSVANADWSKAGPMLTAESLKIGVEPTALFGGDIRITGLEAVKPEILLERAADGRVNWEIGVEGVAASGQAPEGQAARSERLSLTLDRALITEAALSYVDHATSERFELRDMNLDLRWPDYDGAATFEASAMFVGQPVEVAGQLEKVGNFIDGGVSDLQAQVMASGGVVSFAGQASTQPQVGGRLTVDLDNTASFLAAFGVSGVDIPQGLGRALSLSGDLTLTPDMRVSLRDTTLGLDKNRLTGAADIHLGGDKPRVNAQLNADALDFSALAASSGGGAGSGGSGGTGGAPVPAEGWPKTPIDVSALALADAEVALVANSVDLGDFKLGKTRSLITLDRSRAVFELRELRAYSGLITGQFVVNNRSGLSVGGQMSAADIDLKSFLTDAVDISRFATTGDAEVSFLGVGQSLHAIMNSLKGDGAIKTGRGVISGFDLDRLMRSGDFGDGTTVFDSLSASFTMQQGNLFNSDLLLGLPLARARGEGRIGLGARDIDYLFTPTLLEGENRKGLAIPVRVRGPWSNPKITPDLEKALDLNLKAEKEKLEQKLREEREKLEAQAKEEVNKTIKKELGVTVQEGQSLEDAFKKKLEDEAAKGLLKLFE